MQEEPRLDFARLFRDHARDVHRFAMYLSGDAALADDIVSETFIRLWNARARIDLTTVRAYLLTIARNLFLHERRLASRRAALDVRMPDGRPDPEVQVGFRRELHTVLAALQSLPEIDRAAVLMRANDGMTYEEIATSLGISLAAAKVKVHRARLRLAHERNSGPVSRSIEETTKWK
ncbi:MAG TPA: RNA polymerase sigma factor [Thermoanaerobaculia bacterium]|nr:RNA polymerase sigma factor [Thermoanaerobaculia bacterium]HQR67159.1 RNA polymerase sigma factor [Thermoanaerobaculia bacterium]